MVSLLGMETRFGKVESALSEDVRRKGHAVIVAAVSAALFIAAFSYITPELVRLALRLEAGGTIDIGDFMTVLVKSAVLVVFYSVVLRIVKAAVGKRDAWSSFWVFVSALIALYVTGVVRDSLGFTAPPQLEFLTYIGKVGTGLAYAAIGMGMVTALFTGIFKHQLTPHPREAKPESPPEPSPPLPSPPPPPARVTKSANIPATTGSPSLKRVKPRVSGWGDVSKFLKARIPCVDVSVSTLPVGGRRFVVGEGLARLVSGFPLLNAECSLIGCGGWGCVYACRVEGGSLVALKLHRVLVPVLEGGSDWVEAPTLPESLVRGVRSEVEAVRRLRHPNIVRLIAYSEVAPLVIYEFVEGGSLRKYLTRFRGDVKSVALLGIQVGDALRYMHSRGLVHGDVKPGNILVTREGFVKVGDYSSVRRLLEVTSMTRGATYCTPGYCAPEQVFSDLRAKAAEAGMENRVDVYQLGNTLLEALTGEVIDGEHAVGRPDTVRNALSKVSNTEFRELLKEMLNPDPLSRPSMEEVIKKLITILHV